ncbi:MAG: hypothetical protein M3Y08_20545 [Fibrobacterota bacterium]|nr:hypothetical protein [Fibrobacterota bacterium]
MFSTTRMGGRQAGFGMLEVLTGLIVFVILAAVATRAFKGVVANQKETAQVKALTDAVTVTAERLNAMSVATLTAAGSKYLQWSVPEEIGSGKYHFRYRTVPRPLISGVQDTTVVGLEVETGSLEEGVFTPNRSFATLVAPHLSSKNALGQVSTKAERDAEAVQYASLMKEIAAANQEALNENQVRLNSFNCYDRDQCCDFMKEYFANPEIQAADGMKQKCLYRCALGGSVPLDDWKASCRTDFCTTAPWKTSEQCCAAIASGECKTGSVCAQVCIDCLDQDGSTCAGGNLKCDDGWWNDFFDCANGTMCDGSPMPDYVEGWGNVKGMCATSRCSAFQSQCQQRLSTCCRDYWSVVNIGGTPIPDAEICRTISNASDCCMMPIETWAWDQIQCGTDGKLVTAHNKVDGKWYCGMTGQGWDKACGYAKGCNATYTPTGSGGSGGSVTCLEWTGLTIDGPWQWTYSEPPKPAEITVVTPPTTTDQPATSKPTTSIDYVAPVRTPSRRSGGIWGNGGGRE